jgi:hypothetical protein
MIFFVRLENISEYGGFPIACYTHHMDSFWLQIVIDCGILLCNHYWKRAITFLYSLDTSKCEYIRIERFLNGVLYTSHGQFLVANSNR